MIKALKNRAILQLWLGQLFSSIGNEIYRVGLTWMAIDLMGNNTGLLVAGQMATLMIVSIFAGKWADRLDPIQTMIRVDLIRGILVFIPVIIFYFFHISTWQLILIAFSVAGLNAFFDPAIQAALPILSKDNDTLSSANGLMSTTTRTARMIGPSIISLLTAIIPTIHFFTIDSITYFCSVGSMILLLKYFHYRPEENLPLPNSNFLDAIKAGIVLAKKKKDMVYILIAKALTLGTWSLSFYIGFGLLIHQRTNGDAKAYSLLIASYGLGNFIGSLVFGNMRRLDSRFNIFLGYSLLGIGFLSIGLMTNFTAILIAAAYTGFTGPLNELAFVEHVQKNYNPNELTKIFRLKQSMETFSALILMLFSPLIIKALTVSLMISTAGIIWISIGLTGLFYLAKFSRQTN